MTESSESEPFETLDLSGVACPMNYVKIRVKLSKMDKGETLGIILDEGQPIQQVPTSLDMDDCDILSIKQFDDKRWQLVIQKSI